MLAMVVKERQDDWDAHLPHVEFACNNSGSATTDRIGPQWGAHAYPSPSSSTHMLVDTEAKPIVISRAGSSPADYATC